MKAIRLVVLLVLAAFVLYVKLATSGGGGGVSREGLPGASLQESPTAVPAKAVKVLQIVRETGQPPEGYVGGRTFENREGRLPAGGDYREFDVDLHNGQRNADRLIVEWTTKKAWYTGDHYRTFIPVP